MKINTKILLSFFLSILITGTIAILISRTISKNIIENQIENNMVNIAISNTHYIESIIEDYKKITEVLAVGNFAKDVLDPEQDHEKALLMAKKRINHTIQSSEKISRIRILNDKGIIIVSTHEDIGEDDSKKDIFIKAKDSTYFGDIHISRYTGNIVTSVSSPVFINNVFSGVVIVNFKPDYQILENRIGLGETGEIYILNKENYMITPSKFVDDAILKQKVNIEHKKSRLCVYPDLPSDITQIQIGRCKNYIGQDVYRVHTHIPDVNWDLVVDINTEEIFSPVSKLTNSLLLILLILLLVGVIVAIIISRTITKPILKLHHGTEEIEKGNMDYKVGTKAKNEIGQLSRAFDKMTGKLKVSKEQLKEYTDRLEEKVKESEQQRKATLNILQDIEGTNIKLKQALIKATESDRLKSTFLSTISHELRTPLNAIIGFSEIIDTDTPKEEIIDYVKMINKSGHNLFEIIEDILDVTDIESGKSELSKTEFRVSSIFDEIVEDIELIQEKEDKKHLEIKLEFPDDAKNLKIFSIKSKIKKILIHLLRNAFKFTENGFIEYGLKPEKDKIIFYVKDTGVGIPENKQDIVFDQFRQVDDSHTRKFGGMGIGLSLVKKIIELLDGEIWFDSVEGKGSTFYFSIPIIVADKEKVVGVKDDIKKVRKNLAGKTILVAEDEDSNFMLLEKILGFEKINIIKAVNGKKAVEKFKENIKDIDLILMDIKMPVMNGYEATNEIRKVSDVTVIALSAYTSIKDKEEAINSGCNEFIEKPIRRNVLLKKINEFVNA